MNFPNINDRYIEAMAEKILGKEEVKGIQKDFTAMMEAVYGDNKWVS
jgi:hypothetical protein